MADAIVLPARPTSAEPLPVEVAAVVQRLAQTEALPPDLLAALVPRGPRPTRAGAELSDATRRAYTRDWFHFANWCREQGADPAPPLHPVLVAAYLATLAGQLGLSALNGRLAAIAHEHRRRGIAWNAGDPAIRATLQAIGRTHAKPARPIAALTAANIETLLEACGEGVAGLRDRALLLVGYTSALRRSELVAIDHAHLRFEADRVVIQLSPDNAVTLLRKRDEAGVACPVAALERWLARAKIRRGPVFRSVTAGGRLGERLSPDGVRHILLSRAKCAELAVPAGERLSPHALRAGSPRERKRP